MDAWRKSQSHTGGGHNVGDLIAVYDVGGPLAGAAFLNSAQPGPNPGLTSGSCTQNIPSDHTAINGVCGATFKDVCVAPYAIVQGPSPQVLIGCGAIQQTTPAGDTPDNNVSPVFKGTFAECHGTIYPYSGKSASNQTGSTSANVVSVAKGGTSGTFGAKNAPWPCMNPDYPTAVLQDAAGKGQAKGSTFAVITQMAGIEQVALDLAGKGLGDDTGPPEVDFSTTYLLASASYHAMTTAAAMCTISGTDGANNSVTIPDLAELNCFTVSSGTPTSATTLSTTFACPATSFTASIDTSGVLHVTAVSSGTIELGQIILGTGVPAGTSIVGVQIGRAHV